MENREKELEIPIWMKANLTVAEAAAYTGVGMNKLRKISDGDSCDFVLWIKRKRLLKRVASEAVAAALERSIAKPG